MTKKMFLVALVVMTALALCACGGGGDTTDQGPAPPPDLTGEWIDSSDDPMQRAEISGDVIKIWWTGDGTDALYWQGSFTPPTTTDEPYTFVSVNDTDVTSSALLASDAADKTMTYSDGELSYPVSAMGVDMTIHLVKVSDAAPAGEATDEQDSATASNTADLGDYVVEIQGAKLAEDYEGAPIIVIDYAWTNNSEDTTSASVVLLEQAFQGGVQLETAMVFDDSVYDSGSTLKDIRPGVTLTCQCAYVLSDTTSPVEFEVRDWTDWSSDPPKAVVEYDLTTLA